MRLNSINANVSFRAITRGAVNKALKETSADSCKNVCKSIIQQAQNDKTCIVKSGENYKVFGYENGFINGKNLYYCGNDFNKATSIAQIRQTELDDKQAQEMAACDIDSEKRYQFITNYSIYPFNIINFEPQELE